MRGTRGTLWFKIKIEPLSFIIHNFFRFFVTHIQCDSLSQFSDSVTAAIRRMSDKAIWSCVVLNYGSGGTVNSGQWTVQCVISGQCIVWTLDSEQCIVWTVNSALCGQWTVQCVDSLQCSLCSVDSAV